MSEPLFRLECLGRLTVWREHREIRRFRTQKTGALLAYLAYFKRSVHTRALLIDLFWPEIAPEAAKANLSVALYALRRQLEGPGVPRGSALIADRSQVHLNPSALTTDVEAFDDLLKRADRCSASDQRLDLLSAALDLYQGDLLPGFHEDWILTERDRLREAHLSTLRGLVKLHSASGRYDRAIECAQRIVQADPLQEGAYFSLMRLYAAVERPEKALHQYRVLEQHLRAEVQTQPSAPLREFAAKLDTAIVPQRPSRDAGSIESKHHIQKLPASSPHDHTRKSTHVLPQQFTR
jgi:DNA-binding SARP family transcriptional activator